LKAKHDDAFVSIDRCTC